MERPFALVVKCYGGFVLIADFPPNGRQLGWSRLRPINSQCGAIGHGSVPAVHQVGGAVFSELLEDGPIDVAFPRATALLDQYCQQNAINQSIGFIFAGFDAERRQRMFGWMWNGNAASTQPFDTAFVTSVANPIGQYLIHKMWSFDLSEEFVSRLALYVLTQTRSSLPYAMDEFAEIGWVRGSTGLEIKTDEYVREHLELTHVKSEELRLRCQELLAKEHP
jgi:hypothetical protein